jgi:DNA-binding transcriptional regulator YhcF (GntR family)
VSHPDFHLNLKLDRDSEVPVGTQLTWKLRGAIAAGWLAPGEQLPGVRELAIEAGVNVNTVRAVYGRLADQGVLVAKHGLGTFVSDAPLGDGELRRIAERAAEEAARHGVDPRELAAALYVRPARPAEPEPDAERRHALRERIAALEADVASLEQDITEVGADLEPIGSGRRRRAARGSSRSRSSRRRPTSSRRGPGSAGTSWLRRGSASARRSSRSCRIRTACRARRRS